MNESETRINSPPPKKEKAAEEGSVVESEKVRPLPYWYRIILCSNDPKAYTAVLAVVPVPDTVRIISRTSFVCLKAR